jgi:tetratricopeptide (TPR) repeat protein
VPGYRTLSLYDAPTTEAVEGLHWLPVRRALDVGAFGVNAFRAERAGDLVVEGHEESPGQEELYVVVRGRATFTIDGELCDAPAGTAIFVADPASHRSATAAEDATVVLVVGGWRERPYHALPWEPIYLSMPQLRAGDWPGAAETIEREAGDQRDAAPVRYRLAWIHARAGEADRALDELERAIEISPALSERAREDPAFEGLRGHERWPA